MSSYVNFYIKTKNNDYCSIASLSRNNPEYEYIQDLIPYGKNIPLTESLVNEVLKNIQAEQNHYDSTIKEYNYRKQLVVQMNNSVEEKMEQIYEIDSDIREVNEIHNELTRAYYFYTFFLNIFDEAEYYEKMDKNNCVYVGIDAADPRDKKEE